MNQKEIEHLIDAKISAHERRFSIFGVLTAVLSLLAGIALVIW